MKTILLLVKGSEDSFKAAKGAIELAKISGAKIVALNVISPSIIKVMQKVLHKTESEAYVDLSEDGWKYLYSIEEMAKDEGVSIVLEQEEGILEKTVLECAKQCSADAIVLGRETKKRSALQPPHKLLSMVLDYLTAPVYIV